MEEKKTLLMTAPYFPPAGGGLERYALHMARRLGRDCAWRVVVVTTGEQGNADRVEKNEGMTVYRLGYDGKFSNTPLSFSWTGKLRRILREEEPDLINIHTPVPGLGDLISFLGRGHKQVVTYHTGSMRKGAFLPDLFINLYEKFFLPVLLGRASAIICSSDFVRTGFLGAYAKKSVTVTPGVDCQEFRPQPKKERGQSVLFVASLGRGQEYKGLSTLIDALALITKRLPRLKLIVAGDGELRAAYEDYARRQGIADRIDFRGRLQGEELLDCYREADVFALPTAKDSYPLVVLEAMAAGLPVVSTPIGSIPDMVEDGREGFLVPPHDVRQLAEKIFILLTKEEMALSFSQAARAHVVNHSSWESRVDDYDRVLRQATLAGAAEKFRPHNVQP